MGHLSHARRLRVFLIPLTPNPFSTRDKKQVTVLEMWQAALPPATSPKLIHMTVVAREAASGEEAFYLKERRMRAKAIALRRGDLLGVPAVIRSGVASAAKDDVARLRHRAGGATSDILRGKYAGRPEIAGRIVWTNG